MSAGTFRKQYEALADFATSLGISFTTPDGSFNEKFCELCRIIIVGLGGTFTPVRGTFTVRKAVYLRQVAIALGITTTEAGTSFRETFLKAAFSIWNDVNDGTAPDNGSSFDWRVYQYLNHAIGGPSGLNPLQYLYLEQNPEVIDKTANALDADYVDAYCTTWLGGGDYMAVSDLVGTENVVSSEGTSAPSISAGRIDFTAGTCWNLILDSGHHFLLMEGADTDFYNIGTGADGVAQSVTESTLWGTRQSDNAANAERGFSKVLSFNGATDSYADIGILATGSLTSTGDVIVRDVSGTYILWGSFDGNSTRYGAAIVSGNWHMYYFGALYDSGVSATVGHHIVIIGNGEMIVDGDKIIDVTPQTFTSTKAITLGCGNWNTGRILYAPVDIISFKLNGTEYYARDAYDTTLPDSTGTNDATLVNVGLKAIPANSTGADDVLGLGLTNPACGATRIWNNFEGSIQQKAANTEFLTNPFWSADGVNYDKNGMADFLAHLNLDNNVVMNRPNSWSVKEILTWDIAKTWTPSEYIRMINWLAAQGSIQENLVPAEVTAGTGIGPNNEWANNGDGKVLFVEDA